MTPTTATLMKRLTLPGAVLLTSASLGALDLKDLPDAVTSSFAQHSLNLAFDTPIKNIFSGVGVTTGLLAVILVGAVWQAERRSNY